MSVEIRAIAGKLDPALVEKLRAVALGRSTEIPRMRVIARLPLLVSGARDPLVEIADDHKVPSRLRQVAVGSLGLLKTESVDVLQRYALDPDPGVASAAVKVLGRVADAGSLPTLDRVRQQGEPAVRQRAAFAAALIAHRFSLPGHDLPSVKAATYLGPPQVAIAVNARPTVAEEDKIIKETLARHALVLPPSLATWNVDAGQQRWALVIDQGLLSPWRPEIVAAGKHYLGQLAVRNPTNGMYSPGLAFLLTGTGQGRFEVGMYRSNGRLIHGGDGKVEGDVVRFTMRTTDRPGASATALDGAYSPAGLDLKITTSPRRTRPALVPKPMERA